MVYSDLGRDRVPLVNALALVFFDPYYRTMKGLEVLIEREFISFGHQFKTRLANCQENAVNKKGYVPIFILFLDCIYQAMMQSPLSFEFNQRFIKKLAVHCQTLKFGTFLNNSDTERHLEHVNTNTISIWSYIKHYKKDKYLNELYIKDAGPLDVNSMVSKLVVWKALYSRWIPSMLISKEGYSNEM